MRSRQQQIDLLIIDDEQTTANKLEKSLKQHGYNVHLQLLDDLDAFEKALRNPWDVIVFARAYDMDALKVLQCLADKQLSIPVIAMLNATEITEDTISQGMQSGLNDVILKTELSHLSLAIIREYQRSLTLKKNTQLQQQLHAAEQRAHILVKNSKVAVAYICEGVHVYANAAYNQLFGYANLDELIDQPVIDLIEPQFVVAFKDFLKAYNRDKQQREFRFTAIRADGQHFDALLQLAQSSFDGEECIEVIIQPLAEQAPIITLNNMVLKQDQLTGLANRQAFAEQLQHTLSSIQYNKTVQSLLFISIDNIGHINATAGIAGSDAVVSYVGKLLQGLLQPQQVYRFAESAFVTVLEQSDTQQIVQFAQQLCVQVEHLLIPIDKKTLQTTISIGVVMLNEHSPHSNEVIDRACHAAEKVRLQNKGTGNGVYLYDPAENINHSKNALRETLDSAINQGQLKLLFQHLYDTQEEDNAVFEVYVRLPTANNQLMTPDQFLPIAQEYHLEGRLDRWVLLNACKQLQTFMIGHPNARLLINLGAESLQDSNLPATMQKLLQVVDSPSHFPFILQFNETNTSSYLQIAKTQFQALHELGCQISISDFGSSLQSINLLKHLNVDMVKLDKAYMLGLQDDVHYQASQTLIQNIQPYHVSILGSYIESSQDIAKAWSLGIRYLQGYYFQKPSEQLNLDHTEHV